MKRPAKKSAAPRRKIDPALLPFLDVLAEMIAVRLLAEHRKRRRSSKGGAP